MYLSHLTNSPMCVGTHGGLIVVVSVDEDIGTESTVLAVLCGVVLYDPRGYDDNELQGSLPCMGAAMNT